MSISRFELEALADAIRGHNANPNRNGFVQDQLDTLAYTLGALNPRFDKRKWEARARGRTEAEVLPLRSRSSQASSAGSAGSARVSLTAARALYDAVLQEAA
jgi:hypothetical protein